MTTVTIDKNSANKEINRTAIIERFNILSNILDDCNLTFEQLTKITEFIGPFEITEKNKEKLNFFFSTQGKKNINNILKSIDIATIYRNSVAHCKIPDEEFLRNIVIDDIPNMKNVFKAVMDEETVRKTDDTTMMKKKLIIHFLKNTDIDIKLIINFCKKVVVYLDSLKISGGLGNWCIGNKIRELLKFTLITHTDLLKAIILSSNEININQLHTLVINYSTVCDVPFWSSDNTITWDGFVFTGLTYNPDIDSRPDSLYSKLRKYHEFDVSTIPNVAEFAKYN